MRLTSLGTWWANVLLRGAGAVAPVIGELAAADVATLIAGLSGYDERAYRAELRAWCRERGPGAARELAGYVRDASGFDQRLLAFAGLREAGPSAEEEVRASLDPASARVLLAETLASVLRDAGPAGLREDLGRLGPPEEQVAVLADLWRARIPGAAAVLEVVGKAHPSPQVAKAARKAAFKLGSRNPRKHQIIGDRDAMMLQCARQ